MHKMLPLSYALKYALLINVKSYYWNYLEFL